MLFAIRCLDRPDHGRVRATHRPAHLELLRGLGERVKLAGPLLADDGESMIGSLLVIDFEERSAAERFVKSDPYVLADLFAEVTIARFKAVLP